MQFRFFLVSLSIYLSTYVTDSYSYPENIRHGYVSCRSCHYAPSGGGTLTPYGRRLAEEMQSTWAKENQADLLWGTVGMPEKLQVAGDVRTIYYQRETKHYRESRYFLMQADVEIVAPKIWQNLTIAAGGGYYDEFVRLNRIYLMYDFGESLAVRAGRFKPNYGINTAEHEIATKRPLGLNEGSEVPGLEVSYTQKAFEVFLNAFSGEMPKKFARDSGLALNAALFLGDRSKIGLSAYSGDSKLHKRIMVGPYAILGITEHLYLLSEIDYQNRKIKDSDKSLIEDEEGVFTYNKFGWEILKGLHTFVTYESARSQASDSHSFYDGYGIGTTWYPLPHLETQLTYGLTENPGNPRVKGNMLMAMMHYYL